MAVLNIDNSKYVRKTWTLTEQGNKLLRAKRYTMAFIGRNIAQDKIEYFISKLDFKGEYETYESVVDFVNTNRGNPLNKTYVVFQIIADLQNELSFNIASRDALELQVHFHFLSHTSEFLDNPLALTQIFHTINLCHQDISGNSNIYNIDEFLQSQAQTSTTTTMTEEEYNDEIEMDDFDPSNIKFLFITSRIPTEEEGKTIRLKLSDIGFESEMLFYNSPLDIDFAKFKNNKLAIINTVNDSKAVALDITKPEVANVLILYMHLNGFERLLQDCSDVYMWISEAIDNYVINSEDEPKNTNLASLQQVFIDTSVSELYNNMSMPAKITSGKTATDTSANTSGNSDTNSDSTASALYSNNANANASANVNNQSSNLNQSANPSANNGNTPTPTTTNPTNNRANTNPNANNNANAKANNLNPVIAFVGVNPNQVPAQLVNDLVAFVLGHSNNNFQFFRDYNDLYSSITANQNLLFNIINCTPINYDFVKVVRFGFMLQLANFNQVNYDNARVVASLRLLIDLVKSGSYQNIVNLA